MSERWKEGKIERRKEGERVFEGQFNSSGSDGEPMWECILVDGSWLDN